MNITATKYVIEVKTFGHWRPYIVRHFGKPAEFTFKALADAFAERLRKEHNLETQVVPK